MIVGKLLVTIIFYLLAVLASRRRRLASTALGVARLTAEGTLSSLSMLATRGTLAYSRSLNLAAFGRSYALAVRALSR